MFHAFLDDSAKDQQQQKKYTVHSDPLCSKHDYYLII